MNLPTLGGAMAALSVATDFAMAQPAHFGMRSCALAVLDAAGSAKHRPVRGTVRAGALTEREVEVLRHLARGLSMKQIGRDLAISPKMVDHNLQRIYAKPSVTTRAGATLHAMPTWLPGTRSAPSPA
jgi:DNA-binding NarL/FixJ family response regulator